MATRFYLPASGTAPASPAFAALWTNTGTATRCPLVLTPSNTALSTVTIFSDATTGTTTEDLLFRQYVSDILPAGSVAGTFSLVIRALENNSNFNGFLQVVIRVVSGDGSTVRGTLYAGQTATTETAGAGDPTQEFAASLTTRILSGVTLSSVTAQAGDRIVVDLGVRTANLLATSRSGSLSVGDPTAGADHTLVSTETSAIRPWIEFSQDLMSLPAVATAALDLTGSATAEATAGATASLSLTGSGAASSPSSAASLSLSGSGDTAARSSASASLGLSATGGAAAAAVGAGGTPSYTAAMAALAASSAWWRLGGNGSDASGNARDLTVASGSYVTGALNGDSNQALSRGAASIATASWMNAPSAISGVVWFRTNGPNSLDLLSRGDPSSAFNSGWNLMYNSGGSVIWKIYESNGVPHSVAGGSSLGNSAWHMVGFTWVSGTVSISIDGGAFTTAAAGTGLWANANAIQHSHPNAPMTNNSTAEVDEIALWMGTALTAADFASLYAAGTAAPGASISLSASGGARASLSATASLTLSASAIGGVRATGSAQLSVSASGSASVTSSASASLTLDASGTATAPASASATLDLTAEADLTNTRTGTASLSLSATGDAMGSVSSGASLSLSGTGVQSSVASASITVSGAGIAGGRASGTASLTLSGSGTASLARSGTASLSLTAVGAAGAPVARSGTASLTLSATGRAGVARSGTASLTLTFQTSTVVLGAVTVQGVGRIVLVDAVVVVTNEMRLTLLDSVIARAPSSLTVVLVGAQAQTDITFDIDGTDVYTVSADSDGTLGPTSINLSATLGTAGSHTLTATQVTVGGTITASAVFTVTFAPNVYPTPPAVDAPPVPVPGAVSVIDNARHWVLQDLLAEVDGGIGDYVFPHNPRTMSSPHLEHAMSSRHSTASDGKIHVTQAGALPKEWTFGGFCPSEAHQAAILAYRYLNRRFWVIDHRNRAWTVVFTNAEFVPRLRLNYNGVQTDWGSDFTVTATVLDQHPVVPA